MWLSAWVFAHVLAPDALVTPAAQAVAGAASKAVDACVSTDKSVPQEWCAKTCAMDPAGEACTSACKCPASLLKKHEALLKKEEANESPLDEGQWPRVLLLGTQKGATTAFARTFEKAGLCSSTQGKECHVLVKEISNMEYPENTSASVIKYTSQFRDRDLSGNTNCSVRGHYDGNPFLLTDRGAPVFLRTFMPHDLQAQVRLVAILREPAQRMLSWHNQRNPSKDPRIFARSAKTEIDAWLQNAVLENAHTGVQNFWDADNGDGQWVHTPPLDMMVGMYEHSVHGPMGWKMHWPRRQLFIINFDHFTADAASVLKPLGEFMGLDLLSEPMPRENVHSESKNVCKAMCCETLCALQHVAFADSNRRLYKYMDADSAAHAGPAGELPFGRFKAPECVECGTATACDDLWSE